MKRQTFIYTLILFSMFLGMSSCQKDECQETYFYTVLTPVYMSYEDLRLSISSNNPRSLTNPGNIHHHNDIIFINEIDNGIHVYDNTDPSAPFNIAFLNIPGNIDFSIQGDILYADSFIDLVSIDISDINNIVQISRKENVFPHRPYNHIADIQLEEDIDPEKGVIIKFIETEKEAIISCDETDQYGTEETIDPWIEDASSANNGNYYSSTGVASSLSRFALYNDNLYTIADDGYIKVWSVSEFGVEEVNELFINEDIETLFTFVQNKNPLLFAGSSSGLNIIDIQNGMNPDPINVISEITNCNPLTMDNQYLYYSVRNDDLLACQNTTNEINIVDISNVAQTSEIFSMDLNHPQGLAIHDSLLYICDGDAGLHIYDIQETISQNQKTFITFDNIEFNDVISLKESIMLVNASGLFQYQYNKESNSISFLSVIGIH